MILLPPRFGEPDPHWNSVVLCMNFQGPNGSSTSSNFREEKGHSVTATGPALSNGTSKFGGTSMFFQNASRQLTVADSADWAFGTGDMCIEGWFYTTTSGTQRIWSQQTNLSSPQNAVVCRIDASNKLNCFFLGSTILGMTGTTTILSNVWNYWSMSRVGSNFYIHLNGSQEGTGSTAGSMPDVGRHATMGFYDGDNASGEQFVGYIGPHRITKGVGRYGAGAYTVPKGPFPTFGP